MAKAAVITVIVLLSLGALLFLASHSAQAVFNRKVAAEIKSLLTGAQEGEELVRPKDLEGLPAPVQRWLKNSGALGKEKARTVRVKQKIQLRLEEDKPWIPAEAEQYYAADEPGFVWKVRAQMAPFLYFAGRDMYAGGHGSMNIKLLSLFTVAKASGQEVDQSSLVRYLGECATFPTLALNNPHLQWEALDDQAARVVMSYGGVTGEGVVTFDDEGNMVGFRGTRYMDANGSFVLTEFYARLDGHKEYQGIKIPTQWEAGWKLESGDYTWFKAELAEVEYNV